MKYKHSGATGKLVGVVSIEDITVYYSVPMVHVYVPWYGIPVVPFLVRTRVLEYHGMVIPAVNGCRSADVEQQVRVYVYVPRVPMVPTGTYTVPGMAYYQW